MEKIVNFLQWGPTADSDITVLEIFSVLFNIITSNFINFTLIFSEIFTLDFITFNV